MKYSAGSRTFTFCKDIKDNQKYRYSFNTLAQKTFGLSFEKWYLSGFWSDKYQPYTLLDGEQVVSNASISIINTLRDGVSKRYIQIGTVMTSPEYRNIGLSKFLINKIFEDWLSCSDAVYLYANDSVLNFYPKFGFVKAYEYQATIQIEPKAGSVRKLNMSNDADIATLYHFYQKSNPFSELPMIDNWGLLMFYCSSHISDFVFHIEDSDAVVIARKDKDTLTVFDIFCENEAALSDILGVAAKANSDCGNIKLGFALKSASEDKLSLLHEENTTLFILDKKNNIFENRKTMFPLLSHT